MRRNLLNSAVIMSLSMIRRPEHRLSCLAGCVLLLSFPAIAQEGLVQRLQAGLEGVQRGIEFVGRKAEDLLGPGPGLAGQQASSFTERRVLSERYPVGPSPSLTVSNEFGHIRIKTWPERVVLVEAEIIAGAETQRRAAEVAEAIAVSVKQGDEQIEVRTVFPDLRGAESGTSKTVNYVITVPTSASVFCSNFFGDTEATGIGGLLAVDAQYGQVSLNNIIGPVRARALGEFPFRVRGLAQGGVFDLNGAEADFSGLSGDLQVRNFRGSILLHQIGQEARLDAVNSSGPVRVLLAPQDAPDLSATALYGKVQTTLEVSRQTQGQRSVARLPHPESPQRLNLSATFGDVTIERTGAESMQASGPAQGDKPFNDVLTFSEAVTPETALEMDTTVGDVVIEGADEDVLRVTATRIVWTAAAADAPAALEALEVRLRREEGRIRVQSLAVRDMKELKCSTWRVDLRITCPRMLPVTLRADEGHTSMNGLGGEISVIQTKGEIRAEQVKGSMRLTALQGGIEALSCSGAIEATARFGGARLRDIHGAINLQNVEGRCILETPRSSVTVRSSGGDVRILALEGIGGDYDVSVTQGSVGMLVAGEAHASFALHTARGLIYSSVPVTGRIAGDVRDFSGRLGDGRFQVKLEAENGDVILDGPAREETTTPEATAETVPQP